MRKGHSIISRVTFSGTADGHNDDKNLFLNEKRTLDGTYDVCRKIDVLRCGKYDWHKAVETYACMNIGFLQNKKKTTT